MSQAVELTEAWRAVANARLAEFRRQCWRLATLERQGTVNKAVAIDELWEIALAHDLLRAFGEDRLEAIITEAFAGTNFNSHASEAAT